MQDRLRTAYARLRTRPIVGVAVSRLVWAAKGALGRPLTLASDGPSPEPPRVRRAPPGPPDIRLQIALTAAQAYADQLAQGATRPTRTGPSTAASPRRAESVTVVVSTLNRATWLDLALSALAYQRRPALEVIVVVGPCRDRTEDVLQRHAQHIHVARCAHENLSASRNIGLALARGEVVAFLDDDAVPEFDWLDRLLQPYEEADVGGVGGYIRDRTGVGFQCKVVTADRFGRSEQYDSLQAVSLDPPGLGVERYLSLTGANSSFRRQALLDIGGFDEAYAYFLDETDVCLRLAEAGWRLAVEPSAEVHHAYAPNAERRADRAPRRLLSCVRSSAYFAIRNAAHRHGVAAAVEYLHAYAAGLHTDTLWRRDHGVISAADAGRMLGEITRGLAAGVRSAAGPRQLLRAKPTQGAGAAPRGGDRRKAEDRLRLCLLSQEYPGPPGPTLAEPRPVGGIAVWTQTLAEALASEGHEVTVLTRGTSPSVRFEATPGGGLWLHRLDSRPAGSSRRPALLDGLPASVADPALAAAQEVARVAARRRFHLVMGPLFDLEPAALVGRADCPVAVSLHTACAQLADHRPDWSEAYRRTHVDRVIAGERRLLKAAPHLLANSRAVARDLAGLFEAPGLDARLTVIPHGLPDLADGVVAAPRPPGVEMLFVGRLEPRKGIDVLLDAAATVLRHAPETRLVIVGQEICAPGEPGWAERFRSETAGAPWAHRVRFEGPLPRAALLARYAAADVVAVPSRYESFGLTALEAMIFAKPCVASDVGGLAELVLAGETGLLTPPGDAAALAAALLDLVRHPQRRLAMGAAGRRRYADRFTAAAMAQAFEAWAWSLAAQPGRLAAE